MSGNGPYPNNICPMVVHVQKKYMSKDGLCPNNVCPRWFIDLLICMFINEVLVRSCSLNNEMILK